MIEVLGKNMERISPEILKLGRFPAGEAHAQIPSDEMADTLADYSPLHVMFQPRQGTVNDDVMQIVAILNVLGASQIGHHLHMPYFPAARADRGHGGLQEFGVSIYADLIGSQVGKYTISVNILDVHSWDAMAEIESRVGSHETAVNFYSQAEFIDKNHYIKNYMRGEYTGIVAPDKGAVDRATELAKVLCIPLYRAEKVRSVETGEITGVKMIDEIPYGRQHLLVADDICDGGRTFKGVLDCVVNIHVEVSLFVTHGIFSGKAPENLESFANVISTNSFLRGVYNKDVARHNYDVFRWMIRKSKESE